METKLRNKGGMFKTINETQNDAVKALLFGLLLVVVSAGIRGLFALRGMQDLGSSFYLGVLISSAEIFYFFTSHRIDFFKQIKCH